MNYFEDEGDLFIWEIGNGIGCCLYLFFLLINIFDILVCIGDGNFDMVVMICGSYVGKKWYEFLMLMVDDED